ncbi:MAG: hypothetical protein ACP6IP_00335 [Candidatus Njordarchaeia archaeon]
MGIYTFKKSFIFDNTDINFSNLESALDLAISDMEKFLLEILRDDLKTFLPEAQLDVHGNKVDVLLKIEIEITPLSKLSLNEKKISEDAANVFFKKLEKRIRQKNM